jgi:peptidoglycan/xylan/chitin deacetylase (PgdA/CDA1 family)
MSKKIIICADCEGEHKQLKQIWNVFEEQEIKVNFFFVGITAKKNKSFVKEVSQYQSVDSHTYSHANLRKLSKELQREEIINGKYTVEEIIGKNTYGFRAPCHSINKNTVDILNEEGFIYDLSGLYYRYNMKNVVEICPSFFREWSNIHELFRFKPGTSWNIIKLLFKVMDPLVIPVHPQYSGQNEEFAKALENFIKFAKEKSAEFLWIHEYLKRINKWPKELEKN